MPYKAVLEQVSNVPTGVYVSCTLYGSPASTALRPGVWITEVDGIPVSSLDEFLDAVHHHERKVVRSRQGSVCEVGLKRLSMGTHSHERRRSSVLAQQLLAHPEGLALQLTHGHHHHHHLHHHHGTNASHDGVGGVGADNWHPHEHTAAAAAATVAAAAAAAAPVESHPTDSGMSMGRRSVDGRDVLEEPPLPPVGHSDDAAQSQGYVRIKIQARNGIVSVIAMKLDPIYWSTTQLLPDPDSVSGWKMVDVI